MAPVPDLLAEYGVAVVFAWAFAVQAGLPAPAVPMLLGAGALSGSGHLDLAVSILAAMTATLGADVLWYALGRSQGLRVLETLCRFSRDPDTLIRQAKERFAAHRARYLIVAKFLPGAGALELYRELALAVNRLASSAGRSIPTAARSIVAG